MRNKTYWQLFKVKVPDADSIGSYSRQLLGMAQRPAFHSIPTVSLPYCASNFLCVTNPLEFQYSTDIVLNLVLICTRLVLLHC